MSLPEGFTIREATGDDIATLAGHRRAMFHDMGHSDEAALAAMEAKCGPWLLGKMKAGEYFAWLVIAPDGSVAAGAGLWLMDWIPHVIGASARRGNILNVYTAPEFRRRGLARRLMEVVLAWCREHGIDTVILHAAPKGRPLYESLGFAGTNEMRIRL